MEEKTYHLDLFDNAEWKVELMSFFTALITKSTCSLVYPEDTSLSEWTHVLPVDRVLEYNISPDASHWGVGSLVHSQRYPYIHR